MARADLLEGGEDLRFALASILDGDCSGALWTAFDVSAVLPTSPSFPPPPRGCSAAPSLTSDRPPCPMSVAVGPMSVKRAGEQGATGETWAGAVMPGRGKDY